MSKKKQKSRRVLPSQSSKSFVCFLERAGAVFVRQGPTSHAIYSRSTGRRNYAAPVKMGDRDLRPEYQMDVLRQLGWTREEIKELIQDCL